MRCEEGEPHRVVAELVKKAHFPQAQVVHHRRPARGLAGRLRPVRASNTTPVLVLRFEGHTPEALHRIEGEMLALLRSVKPDAQIGEAAH